MNNLKIRQVKLDQPGRKEEVKLTSTISQIAMDDLAKRKLVIIGELMKISEEFSYPLPNEKILLRMSNFIIGYFSDLYVSDIQEAFDFASSGKTKVDMNTYGRGLTKDLLGRVIKQYANYVRPERKAKKMYKSNGTIARKLQGKGIVAMYAERVTQQGERLREGKTVYFSNHQYQFLVDVGVVFTPDQKETAMKMARQKIKSFLQKQRNDREIKTDVFEKLVRDMERKEHSSRSSVHIEACNQLARLWVKDNTKSLEELTEEWLDKYEPDYSVA